MCDIDGGPFVLPSVLHQNRISIISFQTVNQQFTKDNFSERIQNDFTSRERLQKLFHKFLHILNLRSFNPWSKLYPCVHTYRAFLS